MTTLTFEQAEVIVRKGSQTYRTAVHNVNLTINEERDKSKIAKHIRSEFLNGKLRVEGQLFENCRPSNSIARKGMVAHLKLTRDKIWSLIDIYFADVLNVTTPAPKERTYHWEFLVVGKTLDPLQLFPSPEGLMDIDDFLSLLGATREDTKSNIVFTNEGGFHERRW